MSIDFVMVCKRPLPADWDIGFEADDDLPFQFWIEDPENWAETINEWIEEEDDPDEFLMALGDLAQESWGFVGRINCSPGAVDLVELCAKTLIERFGGFYYDDVSSEPSDVVDGHGDSSGEQVLRRWNELAEDAGVQESLLDEDNDSEWDAGAAEDSISYDDDDWSDL